MRIADAAPGLMMLGLSGFIALSTTDLASWDGVTPGPGFFPRLLAAAGVLIAAAQIATAWRGQTVDEMDIPAESAVPRVILVIMALIAFILLTPMIGMVPAVATLMAFLLFVVLRCRLVPSLITIVIVTLAIEVIFVRWLAVALPQPPFLS